jgi:hypothetical protein
MSNVYTISPCTPAGAAAWVPCDIPAPRDRFDCDRQSAPEAIGRRPALAAGARWATAVKFVERFVPTNVTEGMTATATNEAMSPYPIAVSPVSSLAKRSKRGRHDYDP